MSGTDIIHEDSDDILAAEFALGVLPDDQRAELARRVEIDLPFARLVAQWEERLDPLSTEFAPEHLPPAVKRAIDQRLFGARPARRGFWDSLLLWRGLAGAATAAFIVALALPALQPVPERLAGSLTAEGTSVTYLAVYDSATGEVSLAHLSGDAVEGHAFQLWVARGDEAPTSLGVIPAAVSTRVAGGGGGGGCGDARPDDQRGAYGHQSRAAGRITHGPADRPGAGGRRPAGHLI
ncbi:conserved hypothetical protein [Ketogulonicigenium vulgare Y25]|uniref:anti-sigma factor n=1 Tax=Ketogulonicigenium vulgare TaxID=92945 RepID=UPI0001E677F3|nr:anti-sigma factor [Ketogulonicigenium vulgare]ADO42661.1 conserved hypothetical protein [Ketogulonicigenium vulgare Y25]